METWKLLGIEKRDGQDYLTFDVDGRIEYLYREGLQLKFTLGGYEGHGAVLAALFREGMVFEYNPSTWQCYIKSETV